MEITIDIDNAEMAAIRELGKDGGNLENYIDGESWGETTQNAEKALVALYDAMTTKQASIVETLNAMILRSADTDTWLTLEKIIEDIRETNADTFEDSDFSDMFSNELVAEQCRQLTEDSHLESDRITGVNGDFSVYRRKR